MKTLKLLIFFICAFVFTHFIAEAEVTTKSVSGSIEIVLQNKGGNKYDKRPKAPSRQMIVCTYDGETITMSFAMPEGLCEVCITDSGTGQVISYDVDSSDSHVVLNVGEIGESSIEVVTEYGNSYYGILSGEEM